MERITEDDVVEEVLIYNSENYVRVSRVRHKRSGETLCMKKLFVEDIQEAAMLQKEYVAMAYLHHPNIIKLKAVSFSGHGKSIASVNIFMEYYPEGDLDHLIKLGIEFSEDQIISYMEQLFSAYKYMESQKIAHRDIKPQNILICEKGKVVKVADLGSVTKRVDRSSISLAGTPLYLSPSLRKAYIESRQSVEHDVFKSDVYSLGITFLYMTSLKLPKDLTDLNDLQNNIDDRIRILHEKYSRVKTILSYMLKVDEDKRPNFEGIFEIFQSVKNYQDLLNVSDVSIPLPEPEERCLNCHQSNKRDQAYKFEKGWICINCINSQITISDE
jgi:serine/threonine protein kinase